MDKDSDQLIRRLADSCADLATGERQEYLDRECGEDDELRRNVETKIREAAEKRAKQADHEKVLPEHYRLIEMLGRGGMAEVFLAEDERLNRRVAIKFLNSEFRQDPDRMRRFKLEARAASALNHPNILIIHDIGESEGVQYLVSEFVQGETLGSHIARGKVPLTEAVGIAIQIASALAASHKAGIVHRDLKPDNVMLRPDGSIKVLDFGLAKETGSLSRADLDAETLTSISTSPGLVLGTPQYMSPEQARGRRLDARTDIFSLGVIIYEMVTGRPPFAGESTADIIAAILTREPRRLDEYLDDPPSTLVRIVEKALRKDSEERYGTMDHLLSDLKDLQRELVVEPHAERGTEVTRPIATRRNTLHTAARQIIHLEPMLLLLPLGLIGAIAWWYFGSNKQTEPATTATAMRSVAITSWSSRAGELTAAASFSPDARMVAFASTQSGATEIWVKPTAGGEAIQVTKNGFDNQYPIWSPSGQDIAFFSNRNGKYGIWRVPFTGGEQSQVGAGVGAAARPVYWSKSGKVYFQEPSELFALDERSGERTRVTGFESRGLMPRTIEISADESTVAYSIKEGDLWKVKTERLASDGPQNEIASSKYQIDHIAWHPDGKNVFYSTAADGANQVFQAGEGLSVPVQLSNGDSDFNVQDISVDGSKILYGSVSETSDLWVVNAESSTESVVANDVASEYWADISPDGNNIAYQSVSRVDKPYTGSINIKRMSGSEKALVVSTEGFSPSWSSDGQWIAHFRRTENGIEIWCVRPSGGEALKLADGTVNAPVYTATPYLKLGVNHLGWSRDGGSLAYSAQADGISNIWRASPDGSGNKPLTDNKDATDVYCCPTWTPDGKHLLFTSERQAVHRLWLYQLEDSQQRPILESKERFRFIGLDETGRNALIAERADPANRSATPEATYVYSLSIQTGAKSKVNTLNNAFFHNIHLSRDGRTIAFVARRDNTTALWTVPVNQGTPKRLLAENDPKILISSLAWSPDGRSIVFGKQTRTNLLSMLTK